MKLRTVLFFILCLPIFLVDAYKIFIDPSISDYIHTMTKDIPLVIKSVLAIVWIIGLIYTFPYRRRR